MTTGFDKTAPVLIADDDEYFRLAASALLRGSLGFSSIVEAGSLDEAFERLANSPSPCALALFDLKMPGMDSPANLGAVRECYPQMRVAVISALRSRRSVLDALAAGVHGYIWKSVGAAELIGALQRVIDGDIVVPAFLAELGTSDPADARIASETAQQPAEAGVPEGRSRQAGSISTRQMQVLDLLIKGYSNKQIANTLALGEGTVKVHVAALLRHLNVSNRAGAAAAGALLLRAS